MLDRIQISNYRCLRHVDVRLAPLTVLIGPNNSGKTAFLSAVGLCNVGEASPGKSVHSTAEGKSNQTVVTDSEYWCRELDNSPRIRFHFNDEEALVFPFEHGPQKSWMVDNDCSSILPVSNFQTPKLTLLMVAAGVSEQKGPALIDDQAGNIPAVLDLLLRKYRDRFFRVVETLKELVPGLIDINIETPSPDSRRVDLVLEDGLILTADDASFGVKLILFFVTLANHPSPPKTILVEEPETGVHPKRLRDIVKLLRGLTEGEYADHPTQVILSTHSPYLLDYIDIKKDQVLVLKRTDDGSRIAEPIDKERLAVFLDEFMLGEVWINEDEAGLVRKP